MTVPSDYSAVTISIEPGPLQMITDLITDCAQDIVTALNTIGTTLSNLALGWDGTSASEAQDFANQWMSAMTGLFGTPSNPKTGVINQVVVALLTAIGNNSNADESITTMFGQLTSAIPAGGGGGDDTSPIPAGTNPPTAGQSAIAEINWSSMP